MKIFNINYMEYTGNVEQKKRSENIKIFNERDNKEGEKIKVLLI